MSLFIVRRGVPASLVSALVLGLATAGITYQSLVRADDAPTSQPTTESSPAETPDQIMSRIARHVSNFGQTVGGLSSDQNSQVANMLKTFGDQLKADPSIDSVVMEGRVMTKFREILTPDQQKKFDPLITGVHLTLIGIDFQGVASKMPADLGAMTADSTSSPELFLVSGSKTKIPDDWKTMDAKAKADWVNKNTDFVYIAAGQSAPLEPSYVVAYIKPELAADGNMFLLGDGSVIPKSADDTKAILADLKAGKNPTPLLKSFGM